MIYKGLIFINSISSIILLSFYGGVYAQPSSPLLSNTVTLANTIANFLAIIISLLSVLVFFFFVYNVALFIKRTGESKGKGGQLLKKRLIWSVIILFVLFSLWGILILFKDILLG